MLGHCNTQKTYDNNHTGMTFYGVFETFFAVLRGLKIDAPPLMRCCCCCCCCPTDSNASDPLVTPEGSGSSADLPASEVHRAASVSDGKLDLEARASET